LVVQVKAAAAKGAHLGAQYITKGGAVHDNFESLGKREKTFLLYKKCQIWPIGLTKRTHPHLSKTLEGLDFWETLKPGSDTHSFAQAGFLYEFKQDQTRCFHCNIVLKQ
jgi:hypothetical protein